MSFGSSWMRKTRYFPETGAGAADSFHITDFVRVEAEVDNKGLRGRSVRFLRKASVAERDEILQSPEIMQPGHTNLLGVATWIPLRKIEG